MWLISGGAYQGKLEYVLTKKQISFDDIIDGENCDFQDLLEKPLVTHFHLWVKRMLLEKKDVAALVDQIIQENQDIIIIVNELGCGIVPIDAFDREYRETTGRICCRLAKDATEVHRVVCGIGMVIKHA
ncbi:MAG: adenosylcobinamide kinase [Clostridia bacterium]|nr:adenosylcobinamide kinase [Clostridia bacterium]NCD03477.1 adenosylcobinamide kinase [Clostridia bacterium]